MYSITQCVCVMLLYLIVLYTELINDVIIYIIMKLSCTVVTMELLWAVDYVTIEIGTTTVTHVLAADSAEERDDWIDTLKRASVRHWQSHKHTIVWPSYSQIRQSARPHGGSQHGEKKSDGVSYQTKIVGGVVHRTPIQQVLTVCVC